VLTKELLARALLRASMPVLMLARARLARTIQRGRLPTSQLPHLHLHLHLHLHPHLHRMLPRVDGVRFVKRSNRTSRDRTSRDRTSRPLGS
jgi:hypothetical protein